MRTVTKYAATLFTLSPGVLLRHIVSDHSVTCDKIIKETEYSLKNTHFKNKNIEQLQSWTKHLEEEWFTCPDNPGNCPAVSGNSLAV